jgi:prevent-host-death family protein
MDERKGVEDLRGELGKRVDAAFYAGDVTVVTKNGEPRAVLVPYEWYRLAEAQHQATVTESQD